MAMHRKAASSALAGRRLCSTGAIFRDSVANKTGLSHALDGVMRSRAHDMKTFGAGALRALASRRAYAEFIAGHMHAYRAMEAALDASRTASRRVWRQFCGELRRADALRADLADVGVVEPRPSPAAAAYVARLDECAAADKEGAPPLLLAHFYTRYLADLFGGSMMGRPTQLALRLPRVPAFYVHPATVTSNRRAYVESIYLAINDAGRELGDGARVAVAGEAEEAFRLNGALYREGPGGGGAGMYAGAVAGAARVATGYITGGRL